MRHRQLRRALAVLAGPTKALGGERLAHAHQVRDRHAEWLSDPNISGFGIGQKVSGGRRRPQLALAVFVREKRPPHALAAKVPKTIRIPGIADPVPTDVVQTGPTELQHNSDHHRPAFPGCGISTATGGFGTLGCLVTVPGDPTGRYLLTSAHVVAGSPASAVGDDILQQSVAYGGRLGVNEIATLSAWTTLDFSPGYPNESDAAIGRLLNANLVDPSIPAQNIGLPRGIGAPVARHDIVQINGQSSEYRTGEVIYTDGLVEFMYPTAAGPRRAGFSRQVLCEGFTQVGDSGSLVLNLRNEAVGLHLGMYEGYSVFNPFDAVRRDIGFTLVTA